jgi:hypothetical protein
MAIEQEIMDSIISRHNATRSSTLRQNSGLFA